MNLFRDALTQKDFTGGEFVLTEQRTRMQSRPEAVALRQGDPVYESQGELRGTGRYTGGDGLIREIEWLTDAQETMLADRRRFAPYGLAGGGGGKKGITNLDLRRPRAATGREVQHRGCARRCDTDRGSGWRRLGLVEEGGSEPE